MTEPEHRECIMPKELETRSVEITGTRAIDSVSSTKPDFRSSVQFIFLQRFYACFEISSVRCTARCAFINEKVPQTQHGNRNAIHVDAHSIRPRLIEGDPEMIIKISIRSGGTPI